MSLCRGVAFGTIVFQTFMGKSHRADLADCLTTGPAVCSPARTGRLPLWGHAINILALATLKIQN